ncbi:MAG TPA: OsmC family protein [Allosphingosinicella sp.]|nr:OsmC family protein [Allosphingosinicella sp.]
MGSYGATISWTSDGNFASGKYSRAHRWSFDGGAEVAGSSSPSVVPLPMSDAAAVDPEEALIAATSSCHMLWFLALAQKAGLDVTSYRDEASGIMGKDERGRIAIMKITLRPQIEFAGREPDEQELDALHHEAHQKCFIANSLRSEIVVEPVATPGS